MPNEEYYAISKSSMTGIANAIRKVKSSTTAMTTAQMQNELVDETIGQWIRPSEYPDIESLCTNLANDEQCVYLTYDLRKTPDYSFLHLYVNTSSGTNHSLTRGHIDNGAYVVDETITFDATTSTGGYYQIIPLDSTNGNVQLFRFTATSHVIRFTFVGSSLVSEDTCLYAFLQPCVHRAGNLPYASSIYTTGETYEDTTYGTAWLERDALVPGKLANVTRLDKCWQYCWNLKSIDFSKWDTSNWVVTRIDYAFYGAMSLQYLDLSYWNTSNWKVTTLAYCFSGCRSLKALNIKGWNTSKWAVTSIIYCWQNCYSLLDLDLSNLVNSTWKVTAITGAWSYCSSLRSLNMSGWDTSNWAVTGARYTFQYCGALRSLDLSGWNVGKFKISDNRNMFSGCYSLEELKTCGSIGITTGTNASGTASLPNLVNFTGWKMYVDNSYSSALKLTRQSLINIMNCLATLDNGVTKTFTLGVKNQLKLTAEDIAIATGKGWTVA